MSLHAVEYCNDGNILRVSKSEDEDSITFSIGELSVDLDCDDVEALEKALPELYNE